MAPLEGGVVARRVRDAAAPRRRHGTVVLLLVMTLAWSFALTLVAFVLQGNAFKF